MQEFSKLNISTRINRIDDRDTYQYLRAGILARIGELPILYVIIGLPARLSDASEDFFNSLSSVQKKSKVNVDPAFNYFAS